MPNIVEKPNTRQKGNGGNHNPPHYNRLNQFGKLPSRLKDGCELHHRSTCEGCDVPVEFCKG